jgi:hypothetical protein
MRFASPLEGSLDLLEKLEPLLGLAVQRLEGFGDGFFLAGAFALCAFKLGAPRRETYFAFGGRASADPQFSAVA